MLCALFVQMTRGVGSPHPQLSIKMTEKSPAPDFNNDSCPYAGCPAFNAKGQRLSQDQGDATDDSLSNRDAPKSQKPN